MSRAGARAIAVAGLLLILIATLTPRPEQAAASAETPFSCLVCGDRGMVDVLLNVMLFIPFGFGLRLGGSATRRVIGWSLLLTATAEFLQFVVVPGRDSSLSDVLTNTLGGTIGALLADWYPVLLHPNQRWARRLGGVAAVLWLLVLATSALALVPWAPDGPFVSEWAQPRSGRPPFDGRVMSAWLSGRFLGNGPAGPRFDLRHDMAAGNSELRVAVRTGRPTSGWSSILVVRGPKRPVLALSQSGSALVFEPPTYAYRLQLRLPAVQLVQALPGEQGRMVYITARLTRGKVILSSKSDRRPLTMSMHLSPGFGWSLLLPFDYPLGPEAHLLTALWLAVLALPLGFWWARAGLASTAAAGTMAAVIGIGLGIIPLAAGFPPVAWSEWAAAAGGGAAGWALARRAAYLQGRCGSPSTSVSSSS